MWQPQCSILSDARPQIPGWLYTRNQILVERHGAARKAYQCCNQLDR